MAFERYIQRYIQYFKPFLYHIHIIHIFTHTTSSQRNSFHFFWFLVNFSSYVNHIDIYTNIYEKKYESEYYMSKKVKCSKWW